MKAKALVLLSGGLDSRLAVKLLEEQLGSENVQALYFNLPFGSGCCSDKFCVIRFVQKELVKLHIIDLTSGKLFQEYLNIIKHPKYARGAGLNPCIDCHIFMLKKAKEFASGLGIDIIATGEVLGERPLSQTKKALFIVDKEVGFHILRPLSAKLLQETEWEKSGVINRDKLLDIQGRRRKTQLELAKKYNINFPNPGGGCLLCEKGYCKKLKEILNNSALDYNDIKLLSIGRHFLASKIILGRNEKENLILEKEPGILVIPEQPGPSALIKDKNKDLIEEAKELIRKYSKNKIKGFEIK